LRCLRGLGSKKTIFFHCTSVSNGPDRASGPPSALLTLLIPHRRELNYHLFRNLYWVMQQLLVSRVQGCNALQDWAPRPGRIRASRAGGNMSKKLCVDRPHEQRWDVMGCRLPQPCPKNCISRLPFVAFLDPGHLYGFEFTFIG
jgi:hypothetical protein